MISTVYYGSSSQGPAGANADLANKNNTNINNHTSTSFLTSKNLNAAAVKTLVKSGPASSGRSTSNSGNNNESGTSSSTANVTAPGQSQKLLGRSGILGGGLFSKNATSRR